MARTIWLVSTGDYSDYEVVVTFTTKELAEAYAERIKGDVSEQTLLDELPGPNNVYYVVRQEFRNGELHRGPVSSAHEIPEHSWKPLPALTVIESEGDVSPEWHSIVVRGPERDEVMRTLKQRVADYLGQS